MRMRQLRVRGFAAFALMLTFAGCTSAPRPSPTSSASIPAKIQANGTIAPCLPGDVSLTTTAKPVATPETAGVVITTTLLNRMDFACALTQLICPHGDLYAEVVNAGGARCVVAGVRRRLSTYARYSAGHRRIAYVRQSDRGVELHLLRAGLRCGPSTKAASGMYRARGISDTVGVSSQSAAFTVP